MTTAAAAAAPTHPVPTASDPTLVPRGLFRGHLCPLASTSEFYQWEELTQDQKVKGQVGLGIYPNFPAPITRPRKNYLIFQGLRFPICEMGSTVLIIPHNCGLNELTYLLGTGTR